jgi:VCBS repeat-containing protein
MKNLLLAGVIALSLCPFAVIGQSQIAFTTQTNLTEEVALNPVNVAIDEALAERGVATDDLSVELGFGLNSNATLSEDPGLETETLSSVSAELVQTNANGYQVVDKGANHRVWEKVTSITNDFDEVFAITNRYTELGSGLYFRDGSGTWSNATTEIEVREDGIGIAKGGAHITAFSPNVNTRGAIGMATPDGKRLKSHVLGLAYYDFHAEQSVLIAEVKDSVGVVVGDNQVVYADAFSDFKADIRYTYTRGGVEQDIIFRERPPSPETFGLDPRTTWLEVWTEFVDPPAPAIEQEIRRGWLNSKVDRILDFGDMKITPGAAFELGGVENKDQTIPVQKHWQILEGRTFLIEEVSYRRCNPRLSLLPQHAQAAIKPKKNGIIGLVSNKRLLPEKRLAQIKPDEKLQVAKTAFKEEGFVLDYSIVESVTNFTFESDTTYYISEPVWLSGTTTIKGGTVIKYTNGASIHVDGDLQCLTESYRPAILTAYNDNSVGETLSTNSLSSEERCADMALVLNYGGSVHDLHFRYAHRGLWSSSWDYNVTDCQFIHCDMAVTLDFASCLLQNVLMVDVGVGFFGSYYHAVAENLTFDQGTLTEDWAAENPECEGISESSLTLTNSLLTAVTNPAIVSLSEYGVVLLTSNSGIYQTAGGGSHYLATNSPYRGLGTTSISPSLRASLQKKTTRAPHLLTNDINTSTVLVPCVARATNGVDLGYHYAPLDYLVERVTVSSNLVLSNGVAIGFANKDGFVLAGGSFLSQGQPLAVNRLANYDTVQEGGAGNWGDMSEGSFLLNQPGASNNVICSFTDFSKMNCFGSHVGGGMIGNFSFEDCSFRGGRFAFGSTNSVDQTGASLDLFNCLFESVAVDLQIWQNPIYVGVQNALFKDGSLSISVESPEHNEAVFTFYDTIFDGVSIVQSSNISVYANFNAYLTNFERLQPYGENDLVLTNFEYETGALGQYYQSTNSILREAGSIEAPNVGESFYTTVTNQLAEGNTTVDIGLHYWAVGLVNGAPKGANNAYTNTENALLSISSPGILGNDTDAESDSLTAQVVLNPEHGTLTLNANGAFSYQPLTNFQGSDTFTYQPWDGHSFGNVATVTISIPSVNNPPIFHLSTNAVVLLEDAGLQTVLGFAFDISAGPENESGQTLTFSVTNNNASLFAQQPTVSSGGTLTFKGATNANGTATVTVQLKDNGGVASGGCDTNVQTFTLSITNVNDAPDFSLATNSFSLTNNAPFQTFSNFTLNLSFGPSDESAQHITNFIVTVGNGSFYSTAPFINTNGTLSFQITNNIGTDTVHVRAMDDGGTANGGVNTSSERSFSITVTDPSATNAPAPTISPAGGSYTNPVTVSISSSGTNDIYLVSTNGGAWRTNTGTFTLVRDTNVRGQIIRNGYYGPVTNVNYTFLDNDGDGLTDAEEIQNNTDRFDYFNGLVPVLSIISGNDQTGFLNSFLDQPFLVQVAKTNGTVLTNAPLHFAVTWQDSLIVTNTSELLDSSLDLRTDSVGRQQVYWFLNTNALKTNFITVSAICGTNVVSITGQSYAAQVATPTISPSNGIFVLRTNVQVSSATSGATIRYTVDGTEPTIDSATVSGGQVTVSKTETLIAKAWKAGYLPSETKTAQFSVTGAIASGYNHGLALRTDGTLLAWGLNNDGEIGDTTTINRSRAVFVLVSTNIFTNLISMSAGQAHSLAISNGTVWAWGAGGSGRLGDGTTVGKTSPVKISSMTNVVKVAAGALHSLALKTNGTVWAWGNNGQGRLGNGNGVNQSSPVAVNLSTNFITAIAAGGSHSLALQSNLVVWAWGNNAAGQVGCGNTTHQTNPVPILTNFTAIAAGDTHSLGLSNGFVYAWGDGGNGRLGNGTNLNRTTAVKVLSLSNIVAIAAGVSHSVALGSNGTVWTWGANTYGQLGNTNLSDQFTPSPVLDVDDIIAIAAGEQHTFALKSDGTILGWGRHQYGQLGTGELDYRAVPDFVVGLTNVTNVISAGGSYTLALQSDGQAIAWGSNNRGQLGDGSAVDSSHFVSVANNLPDRSFKFLEAGDSHALGITTDGNVFSWGYNMSGRLGYGGGDQYSPKQITNLVNITNISAGSGHSLFLTSTGTIYACGLNSSGELGIGSSSSSTTPTNVLNLSSVTAISAGGSFSLAISNGQLWAWGNNGNGRLGTGNSVSTNKPTNITGFGTNVLKSIAAGTSHGLALDQAGFVWAWGNNANGQLGFAVTSQPQVPHRVANLSNVLAIAAGDKHSLALLQNGTVRAWGDNTMGQLGDGTRTLRTNTVTVSNLTAVIAISAGDQHSVAVKSDGTVVAWGGAQYGKLGDGNIGYNTSPVEADRIHLQLNQSPTLIVPSEQTVSEDDILNLTIEVDDVDSPGPFLLSLLTTHGVLTLSGTNGLAFIQGTNGFTTNLTVAGSLVSLNAGLANLMYQPFTNYNGPDQLAIVVNDQDVFAVGGPRSESKTIDITVDPANDPPIVVDHSYTNDEDLVLSIPIPGILTNAVDIDGDTLFAQMIDAPTNGVILLNEDGSFSYTPDQDFHGTDSFTYTANDGTEDANVALVSITINSINDGPDITAPESLTGLKNRDLMITNISISDVDGGTNVEEFSLFATNGSLTLGRTNGIDFIAGTNGSTSNLVVRGNLHDLNDALTNFIYRAASNYLGDDTLTLIASDLGNEGAGGTQKSTNFIPITVITNYTLSVTADTYTLNENNQLSQFAPGVMENDTNPPQLVLSSILVASPTNGTITFNGNGSFTYTPNQNYYGTDAFSYRVSDGEVESASGTVALTILQANQSPSFSLATNLLSVMQNVGLQTFTNLITNISVGPLCENGQSVAFSIDTEHPEFYTNLPSISSNGYVSFQFVTNFIGTDTVTVRVQDDGGTANGGHDTSLPETVSISCFARVVLLHPDNHADFVSSTNILLQATPYDGAEVGQIEFFTNGFHFGTVTNSPFSLIWTNLIANVYSITATLTESSGVVSPSAPIEIQILQDSDGDGIPDQWELLYGFNEQSSSDANIDSDGDGLTNLQEYRLGTNPREIDTDYDGRNDAQEISDGTNPLDADSVKKVRLGIWRFNTNDYSGELGQYPTMATNLQLASDWSGTALRLSSATNPLLAYRCIETNAMANFNLRNGTIRCWFNPSWTGTNAGGAGPGNGVCLLGVGDKTNQWWGLSLEDGGSKIVFSSKTNGTLAGNITGTTSFQSNQWYALALTYSATNNAIIVNGKTVAGTNAALPWLDSETRQQYNFTIGSDSLGGNMVSGQFDDMESLNFVLGGDRLFDDYKETAFSRYDATWMEDAKPSGAVATTNSATWTWNNLEPLAFSGSKALQPGFSSGYEENAFSGATNTLIVSSNDTLVTYAFLDPTNPPLAIGIRWEVNGDWNHGVYWGTNVFAWGTNSTQSRYCMGDLPSTGKWVRLEIPSSAVNLEGASVSGLALCRYDGHVWWDRTATFLFDSDNDGLPDKWELQNTFSLISGPDDDDAHLGISNLIQVEIGLNPKNLLPNTFATSGNHSLFILSDSTVVAWGCNCSGELGDGTYTNRSTPVAVLGLTNIIQVAANAHHSIALKSDGTIWTWGDNSSRQCQDSDQANFPVATQYPGVTNAMAIGAGATYNLYKSTNSVIRTIGLFAE